MLEVVEERIAAAEEVDEDVEELGLDLDITVLVAGQEEEEEAVK